jgi:hypothetical protein
MTHYHYKTGTVKHWVIYAAIAIVAVVAGALVITRLSGSGDAGKKEMRQVQKAVSKLVLTPTDEEPSLATVTDKSQLTDAFLKQNTENGDKVLIYPKAAKVYVYRPAIKRVVAIGPLALDASAAQVQGARIVIWDGSGNKAKAQALRDKLASNYPSAKVETAVGTAKRQDFPKTIAIDLTKDEKYDLITNIMGLAQAQRGVLPVSETAPSNADVLVIVGRDI